MNDESANQAAGQTGLKERLVGLLRRILCTIFWMFTTYLALGLVVSHYWGAQYRAAGEPLWMDVIAYGIVGGSTAFVLVLGIRGFLPGGHSWRALLLVVGALIGTVIGALHFFASGQPPIAKATSPELEASRAEINRVLGSPLVGGDLGFTKTQVVNELGIDTPLVKDSSVQNQENSAFAWHTLVGSNRSAAIGVTLRGRDDILGSCTIVSMVNNGTLEGGQLSHRLIQAFLNKTTGHEAWPWIVAQYNLNARADRAEVLSERTFGNNVITLLIAKGGDSFSIQFRPRAMHSNAPR